MAKLRSLFQSSFVRNVSVLAGGTAFAQALGLLTLPLLTRIYTPSEYGVLGVFSALLAFTSVAACLRYEIAIPLPDSNKKAANLVALCLLCLMASVVILTAAILPFSTEIANKLNSPELSKYLWLLPVAIAATGAYNIFQYWATRKKAFARITRTRMEQSLGGVSTQLLLGWAGFGTLGLIIGQVVNSGAGFLGLARRAIQEDREALQGIQLSEIKAVGREYDRFPKYSTFDSLANSAGIQLPMVLIATLASGAEVGFLVLAMRIMQAPMGLIGSSISQVYFSRAVDEHREGRLGRFTARTIGGLAQVGVGPLLAAGIVAPSAFGFIFGEGWVRAGELIAWMTPWFVLQFLASPISMSLHVTSNQRNALLLTSFGLLLRVSLLYVGAKFGGHAAEGFAVSGFIYYSVCLCLFCRISGSSFKNVFAEFKKASPFIAVSVVAAFCLKLLLNALL